MKDHGISINEECPCEQEFCPIRGNCVICVQNHLEHRRHIPECFQDMLRDDVKALADKMELKVDEARPGNEFWKEMAKTDFVEKSLARHKTGKDAD